jgi:hypothetical protein
MNREDGFPIADIDVGLFHDPKVIALARGARDERVTAARLALYLGLVLQSWAAGDRVTLDEAIPAWWMGDLEDDRGALCDVGLIDAESRIPDTAWTGWYIPAFDRREKRRQSGAEGGRRSWQSRKDKRRRSDASAGPNPSDRPAVRHSDRQDRPDDADARDLRAASASSACFRCHRVFDPGETPTHVAGKGEAHATCPRESAA